MNIRYLQLLRALIHNQVKFVDDGLKEEGQDPKRFRMLVDVVSESVVTNFTIFRQCKCVESVQNQIQNLGNTVKRVG